MFETILDHVKSLINTITKALRPSPTFEVGKLIEKMKAEAKKAGQNLTIHDLGLGEPAEGLPEYIRAGLERILKELGSEPKGKWEEINKYNPKIKIPLTDEEKKDPANAGLTHTTVTLGALLKQHIKIKFRGENQLDYTPAELTVSNGGKQTIYNALAATLNPGDTVLLPEPSWVSYADMAKFITHDDTAAVGVKTNEDFKITPDTLTAALAADTDKRAKWLILNSPSNPTGATYTREELHAIAQVVLKENETRKSSGKPPLMVMSDDIYEHMVYKPEFLMNPDDPCSVPANIVNAEPKMKDYTLIVNGTAKAFAMTGLRVGFAAGPKTIIEAMDKLQGLFSSNISTLSQLAAIVALDPDKKKERGELFTAAREAYEKRMRIFKTGVTGADEIKWKVPPGAFYAFADFSELLGKKLPEPITVPDGKGGTRTITHINDGKDMASYLTMKANAAGVPGDDFFVQPPQDESGKKKVYVRFSLATAPEILEAASKSIKTAVDQLMGRTRGNGSSIAG